MRSRWFLASLALFAGTLQAWASSRLDHSRGPGDLPSHPEVPSVPTALLYGLMRPPLAADLQMVRVTSYAGDARFQQGRPSLAPLVHLAVTLDPNHESAYRVGGLLLASEPGLEREAVSLFLRGSKRFPDSHRFPFYAGCLQLSSLSDAAAAEVSWREAARRPGAPPFLEGLVSRLRGRAGRCFAAVVAVTELRRHAPATRARALEERHQHLRLECALLELEEGLASYRTQHGHAPARLEELVETGLLPRVPPEPLGGEWILEANGTVRSTSGLSRIDLGQAEGAAP